MIGYHIHFSFGRLPVFAILMFLFLCVCVYVCVCQVIVYTCAFFYIVCISTPGMLRSSDIYIYIYIIRVPTHNLNNKFIV